MKPYIYDEKDCECGCGRTLVKKEKENDYSWAKRSYFEPKCCQKKNKNFHF